MKRVIVVVALLATLALVACGGEDDDAEPAQDAAPAEEQQDAEPTDRTLVVRVEVWDDTETNPVPDDMEVWARGHGSFFPDVEFSGDVVEEMTITDRQLIVYPEGREVPEHVIELEPPDDFTEASAMHMISIEISDDAVEVSGTSVPGRTERFDRR